jgi:hypothetical protein
MSLDHGILNVPLSKRGDIDRDIDKWKLQQAKEAEEKRQVARASNKENRIIAKELLNSICPELVERVRARTGETKCQLMKRLHSDAHFNPNRIIAALGNKKPTISSGSSRQSVTS